MVMNVTQVKEKFGGLRFYYDGGNNYIDGMVSFAEAMSYKTCEFCGTTHNVGQTNKGWIFTICKECIDTEKVNATGWKSLEEMAIKNKSQENDTNTI